MTGAEREQPELDPLKREAIAWVQRLTSGAATAADANALVRWRSVSPAHAAAFLEASRLWRDLEPAGSNVRQRKQRMVMPSRRMFLGGGLAASVAIGAYSAIRPPLGLWPSLTELAADYRTSTGEQRNLALSDHVSIRMNTRTSLAREAAAGGGDRIKLITGEASFFTAQPGYTLSVAVGDSEIAASDATFDVRYLPDDAGVSVCATCLKGELRVQRGPDIAMVKARQQLRYDSDGAAQIKTIDPEVVSAWHQGVLIFRFTPLVDVVAEINRYRAGRIVITNAAIGRVPVSGRFRIDRMDDVLAQIKSSFGAKSRALPGGIVLLS